MPDPIRLFHITAIDNLENICQTGALLSKSEGAVHGVYYQNIAHSGAQGSRALKPVPNPPGGTVHNYVPFYFAPRSPMLYAINRGKVQNCVYRQEDILHFETTVEIVTNFQNEVVFYDRNATLVYSKSFTDISDLNSTVAWDLLTEPPCLDGFCKFFHNSHSNPRYLDRMERRQAEFLVKTRVQLDSLTRIGVIDKEKANIVQAILVKYGLELKAEIMKDWYFLGQ